MSTLLRELCLHQGWADSMHWKTIESHQSLLDDSAIKKRLHHYHLTQRAFLSIVLGEELSFRKLEDFSTMRELKEYAMNNQRGIEKFLQNADENSLQQVITIPWFRNPPIQVTIEQALTQAAMHSHYHRAQNAIRIKELGCEPPLTDYIAWLWKGKPEAVWISE